MVILSYIAKAGIHALLMLRACGVHGSNKALLARACLYNKCPEAKKHFHLLATPTCYDRVFNDDISWLDCELGQGGQQPPACALERRSDLQWSVKNGIA
jgi:hypothetical protein